MPFDGGKAKASEEQETDVIADCGGIMALRWGPITRVEPLNGRYPGAPAVCESLNGWNNAGTASHRWNFELHRKTPMAASVLEKAAHTTFQTRQFWRTMSAACRVQRVHLSPFRSELLSRG